MPKQGAYRFLRDAGEFRMATRVVRSPTAKRDDSENVGSTAVLVLPTYHISTEMIKMYELCPDIIHRCIDGKNIVINMKNGEITVFEGTGDVFFETILESKSFDEIHCKLSSRYNVSDGELENDISNFILDLIKKGIIHALEMELL